MKNDPEIAPSQIYAYAALKSGVPFANGAPNLTTDTPALLELARERQYSDLRQGFQDRADVHEDAARAGLEGAHAGDRAVGFRPTFWAIATAKCWKIRVRSRPRKRPSCSVLDQILQPKLYPELYKDLYHAVRINYYPPRGDSKEGWDNIDIFGWLGYPMQIKIDFLCRDSILAAPLVLDLVLFMDLAQRCGNARDSGMAVVLLQGSHDRAGLVSGARHFHPVDETEEHAALDARRGPDHASWA